MKLVEQLDAGVRDALTVQRVFGDAYERDGLLVIPVAKLVGGGGGGEGRDSGGDAGGGGGFAVSARPAGVYVVSGDRVRWEPALDANRIVLGAQVVAVVGLLIARRIARARRATGATGSCGSGRRSGSGGGQVVTFPAATSRRSRS